MYAFGCVDCRREYDRLRYSVDPNKKITSSKKWTSANKARHAANTLRWAKNNPEKHRKSCRNWEQKHPDRIRLKNYKRRTYSTTGTITEQEWSDLKVAYGHRCLCCLKTELEIRLTLDHVIPLSRGGTNTIDNAQPLCKSCNSSKGTKRTDYRIHTEKDCNASKTITGELSPNQPSAAVLDLRETGAAASSTGSPQAVRVNYVS